MPRVRRFATTEAVGGASTSAVVVGDPSLTRSDHKVQLTEGNVRAPFGLGERGALRHRSPFIVLTDGFGAGATESSRSVAAGDHPGSLVDKTRSEPA